MIEKHPPGRARPGVVWAIFPDMEHAEAAQEALKEGLSGRDVITLVPGPSTQELATMPAHPDVPQQLQPGQGAIVVVLWGSSREAVEAIMRRHEPVELRYDEPVELDQARIRIEAFAQRHLEGPAEEEAGAC